MDSSVARSPDDCEDAIEIDIVKSSDGSFTNSSEGVSSTADSIGFICDKSQHEDSIPVSTSDSDGAEKQGSKNGGNWTELPPRIVEKIYSLLSRLDRSSMSLVCSRWEKVYSSPSLWESMTFHLPESTCSTYTYPEIKFARKYGSLFKQVEIIGPVFNSSNVSFTWIYLKEFLQVIELSSQLQSIKINEMGNCFYRSKAEEIHEDLFDTLISFFNSQNKLETVDFKGTSFYKEDGVELLKAVLHSDCNTIEYLGLKGFVNEEEEGLALGLTAFLFVKQCMALSLKYISNVSDVCLKFACVKVIEAEYSKMFEDLIKCLNGKCISGEYQLDKNKPNASLLEICFFGEEKTYFDGTLSETLDYLIDVFPTMKSKGGAAIILRNYVK